MDTKQPIFSIHDGALSFSQYQGGLTQGNLQVIHHLDLDIYSGQLVAIVGASGSGKSLLAHSILGILPYNATASGTMTFCGEPLTQGRKEALRGREIVLVPQSVDYLDPLMQVGQQIRTSRKDDQSHQKSAQLLERYGLGSACDGLYPFELSGGMARRVLISTALMDEPKLVIADEPTPGLHLTAAKRVLRHFREIADTGAGVLLITHDLELAMEVADRIVVFYAGTTVEDSPVADFRQEDTLRHPYTRALWRALPQNGFVATQGAQPYAKDVPTGCPFRPRCADATEQCTVEPVPYTTVRGGRVRCVKGVAL